jgi:hypothetical protein
MLSKLLAVVLAVTVLTVGGYSYWQYTNDAPAVTSCSEEPTPDGCKSVPAPCCQEPSRSACLSIETCCGEKESTTTEVLTIEPREVK